MLCHVPLPTDSLVGPERRFPRVISGGWTYMNFGVVSVPGSYRLGIRAWTAVRIPSLAATDVESRNILIVI